MILTQPKQSFRHHYHFQAHTQSSYQYTEYQNNYHQDHQRQ